MDVGADSERVGFVGWAQKKICRGSETPARQGLSRFFRHEMPVKLRDPKTF